MVIGINTRFLKDGVLEGMGRYTWEIAKRMVLSHPDVTFYFFFDRQYSSKYIIASNIIPIVVSPPARHPILFYVWYEWRIPKLLRKYKVDVFFSPDNFLSIRGKVPTCLVVHDLAYIHYPKHLKQTDRWYYQYFMPKFIRRANHIISVSNHGKQDLIIHFQAHADKLSVAYNALPNRISDVEPYKGEKPYFIYIGSLHDRKNIDRMLDSWSIFCQHNPDYQLSIVGRDAGLSKNTYAKLVNMERDQTIKWLQGVDDATLVSYLNGAKAMVYISLFEGFGIPILEAMAAQVPVITSNVSSMPEVAGDAAILVDPLRIDEIVSAMTKVINTNVRDELVKKGNQRLKDFNWEHSAQIIFDVLYELHQKEKAI